ncbi:hypothetical protein MINS_12270 [Mycolicibacterium insubricum]|uniref:Uncharacterized protein n=1 Tax=Mycolicibacterium insubricum TaxID=444597 RepID=A0A1X0CKM3_9MYCO|nr:DUF4326 domain-containing protein [Mycolicibacterium insubricum]ORA60472.1 hypothetical protein BST26_21495 [Mycolicibacterium insubricum]BBZ65798.1 hypothetical protein MINS_12270 [Mycolicibacterium insubricum]
MNTVTPQRIQRHRTKGWRLPAGALYVGRPTRFGNPFPIDDGDPAEAVDRYREWLTDPRTIEVVGGLGFSGYIYYNRGPWGPDLNKLRGHDLACWCPLDRPCHADVLLELANGATTGDEAHR